MKFSIKGFFNKYDQIRRKFRIWLHLLKKSLMENFIFCVAKWTGHYAAIPSQQKGINMRGDPATNYCIYFSNKKLERLFSTAF